MTTEIAVPEGTGWTEADLTVSDVTAARLKAAESPHTQDAYARNWGRFADWCDDAGRVSLPASPHTLLEYVQDLTSRTPPLAPATVYQVIATIRTVHRDAGFPGQPDTRAARQLVRGYRRERADAGFRVRRAAPLSAKEMHALVATCDRRTMTGIRDRALLMLGYNLLARASELAGLTLADIRPAGEDGLMVYIRKSKTDQEARGEEMNIPYGRYEDTCTVRAVRAWTEALAEHDITSGALFRRIDKSGVVVGALTPAPRFALVPPASGPGRTCPAGDCYKPRDGRHRYCAMHRMRMRRYGSLDPVGAAGIGSGHLTRNTVTDIIRWHACAAGIQEPQFISGHSARSGAATALHNSGAPVSAIEAAGRWTRGSAALGGYLRVAAGTKNNPLRNLDL